MSVITTVAGTGTLGDSGDGGPATGAELYFPAAVSITEGAFLIADGGNSVIRGVENGTIYRAAGTGTPGNSGGIATDAQLNAPLGVTAVPTGGFLIADTDNHEIRGVLFGFMEQYAGNGTPGYSGDGGPARDAQLNEPFAVLSTEGPGLLIADTGNNVLRAVTPEENIITVAGNGTPGYSGDGGRATGAQLSRPAGLAATADGGFLIADSGNHVVRKLSADGIITTVAGNGTQGNSGDGGPATSAQLVFPVGVAALADGGFLIADSLGNVVRRVAADGIISRVAGNGTPGQGGDGGPPTDAQLNSPYGVAVTHEGELVFDFLIADAGNNKVRAVSIGPEPVRLPPPFIHPA
jgi:hypothetical protein